MGEVGDLVGHHGAASAGMVGPAEHSWFEEGAVNNQLAPTVEQVGQTGAARRSLERICLRHGHPRHPPTLGGQGITGTGLGLFLYEQLLAGRLPSLWRHDWRSVHGRLCVFWSTSTWCVHGM